MIPKNGYVTAHDRTRRVRSKATAHKCTQCAGAAGEWAYNHEAPDPAAVTDHLGRVYSNNPSFYIPMCVPCHRSYDARHAKPNCPKGHPYSGDNLVINEEHRRCRECRNEHQRNLRKTPEHQAKERERAERRKANYVRKPPRPEVTHCPQGHAYEGYNLIIDSGKKKCRECGRARSRRYYNEHKGSIEPRSTK